MTQRQKLMMIGLLSFAPVYLLVTWSLTFFIVSGVLRHWNDVPSELSQTQEKGLLKTNCNFHED